MQCPYCGSFKVPAFFQTDMPNILAACPKSMLGEVRLFPIEIRLCEDCLLGFNSTPLSDDELDFIYTNYLYISPSSGIGKSKYDGMIETLLRVVRPDERVLEIGCSEGYLLHALQKNQYKSLQGIEPSGQAEIAAER